jgi:integrase
MGRRYGSRARNAGSSIRALGLKLGDAGSPLGLIAAQPLGLGLLPSPSRLALGRTAAALRKADEQFGQCDPATITGPEVAEWVAQLAQELKPGTVKLYVAALRLLFDFAGLAGNNPARDPRVKLPKMAREEPNPPPADHLAAILDAVDARHRLLLVMVEQGGMRVGEAVGLRWGDVDSAGSRLRLRRAATKRDKARWVQLPVWLTDAVEATCPSRIGRPIARCSRARRRTAPIGRWCGPASWQGCRTTIRTTCATDG